MRRPPAVQTTFFDEATNMTGFIVADRVVDGRAMGGTRIAVGVTVEEVAALARSMSLKLALAGVPMGGSKAGIVIDADTSDEVRQDHLRAFGRMAGPLMRGGIYVGTDLGCTYEDRTLIHASGEYAVEGQVPALPCTWDELWRYCRDVTGLGVAHAAAAAIAQIAPGLRRPRMVIQGFGEVGKAVARHGALLGLDTIAVADERGTVIDESGLSVDHMLAITNERGIIDRAALPSGAIARAEPEAWLDVDADILVLAATGDAVTMANVDQVRARVIVEGANSPTSDAAIRHLASVGCAVIPDIVANAGGAIGCGLALRGAIPTSATPAHAARWLFEQTARRIRGNLSEILQRSGDHGGTLHDIAYTLAEERIAEPFATHRPAYPRVFPRRASTVA